MADKTDNNNTVVDIIKTACQFDGSFSKKDEENEIVRVLEHFDLNKQFFLDRGLHYYLNIVDLLQKLLICVSYTDQKKLRIKFNELCCTLMTVERDSIYDDTVINSFVEKFNSTHSFKTSKEEITSLSKVYVDIVHILLKYYKLFENLANDYTMIASNYSIIGVKFSDVLRVVACDIISCKVEYPNDRVRCQNLLDSYPNVIGLENYVRLKRALSMSALLYPVDYYYSTLKDVVQVWEAISGVNYECNYTQFKNELLTELYSPKILKLSIFTGSPQNTTDPEFNNTLSLFAKYNNLLNFYDFMKEIVPCKSREEKFQMLDKVRKWIEKIERNMVIGLLETKTTEEH